MPARNHSIRLDRDKCMGCTHCLRRCPMEAIRIRHGKARMLNERCIDCGECIRVCPHHAKAAVTDPLSCIEPFSYRIALPAPAFFGQFAGSDVLNTLPQGLREIGFDDVFEVSRGAQIIGEAIRDQMGKPGPRPLISSSCPVIMRLIQLRFPGLIKNIIPLKSPMEVAARLARERFCRENHVKPEKVGVFFITPCPAKVTAIRSPLGIERSEVNGAISMVDIYAELSNKHQRAWLTGAEQGQSRAGVAYCLTGGEGYAAHMDNALAVDGFEAVEKVLEEIENGKLDGLDFFEGMACKGGCVGGALTFENPYVAKQRIQALLAKVPDYPGPEAVNLDMAGPVGLDRPVLPAADMQLDDDLAVALQKMDEMERLVKRLPGLDCGSCGSPTCLALAEDIVLGYATEMDCIFRLKDHVSDLAREMMTLSEETRDKPVRGEINT